MDQKSDILKKKYRQKKNDLINIDYSIFIIENLTISFFKSEMETVN